MKVIPQTRHSHYIIYLRFYFYFTMSVPDEGYSTNTSFALHYFVSIFILLWAYLMKVIPQTRHSFLFWSYSTNTYSNYIIFVSIFILLWAYLMKVIPQTRHSTLHYISSFLFLFYYERTWWRLFHKHVIRTTLYIFVSIFILLWAYLMKVIPQTRHSHYISYLRFYFYFTMSVPDEGYSTNTSFALHYISSFLFLFYYERTWWRLFHKHVIRTTLAIFVSIFILLWAYLMKVIPQTRHSHYISYLRFYFYFTMSVPDEGYSTNTSFALLLAIFVPIFILLWAYLMKVIPQTRHSHYIRYLRFYFYFTMSVPDEGYSTNTSFALHYISSFLFYILLWAYLMKVIPQTHHSHYISYLRFYFYFTMSVPDEGYYTNTLFALHYTSSFLFLFYYERTWWRLFHKHVIRTLH